MRRVLAVVIALVWLGSDQASAAAECPAGTYPWADGWGNATCRSFGSQRDVITRPDPATGLPSGAQPSTDAWGNRTAQGTGPTGGRTYYRPSRDCPFGFHRWIDQWGNPACLQD